MIWFLKILHLLKHQMQMNYLKNCSLLLLLQIENITETGFFLSTVWRASKLHRFMHYICNSCMGEIGGGGRGAPIFFYFTARNGSDKLSRRISLDPERAIKMLSLFIYPSFFFSVPFCFVSFFLFSLSFLFFFFFFYFSRSLSISEPSNESIFLRGQKRYYELLRVWRVYRWKRFIKM